MSTSRRAGWFAARPQRTAASAFGSAFGAFPATAAGL